MSINESGEFIRSNKEKEKGGELDPIRKLADMYDGFSGGSVLPHFVEKQSSNVRYWWDVERVQEMLDNMTKFARENNITQIVHPVSGETIILKDFFDMVDRSIEYSKEIKEREKIEPPPPDDLTADQRKRMREQILGEQKDKDPEEIMRRRKIV